MMDSVWRHRVTIEGTRSIFLLLRRPQAKNLAFALVKAPKTSEGTTLRGARYRGH